MASSILAIGTAVPETRLPQRQIRDLLAAQHPGDRLTQRLLTAAFDAAAIETRHTVLSGLAEPAPDALPVREGDRLLDPGTRARNDEYRRLAPALFAQAARRALAAADLAPADVTHVITVSCTGLFAPGPDVLLVRDLGLRPTVERTHHGFVGCAAALPALRAAQNIVAAEPDARVLVVCAELCSLHIRVSTDPDQIVAASVFADGAAAAIVAAPGARPHLEFDGFATVLSEDGAGDMAWTIDDHGFEMTLTSEVPRIVGREAATVTAWLGAPDVWAVHPGGRSILDRFETALDLPPDALDPSRDVLRAYGNMSSATILFILRDLLAQDSLPDGTTIGAVAFGPGLTIESARMRRRTGSA